MKEGGNFDFSFPLLELCLKGHLTAHKSPSLDVVIVGDRVCVSTSNNLISSYNLFYSYHFIPFQRPFRFILV